jgi:phosphatidylglycerol---prolipoprotein diacylglyceryl transferase
MRPELINLNGFVIHGYPAMLALAFLVCTLMASRESQRQSPPFYIPPRAGVWGFFGALIGAKAFWILQYASWRDLWRTFFIWESGLVFYGGLIGGAVAAAIYLRVLRIPIVPAFDVAAPYVALGEAITRIGCFLNGCCWGVVSAAPWALRFPRGSFAHQQHVDDGLLERTAEHSLAVHPTQLYMVLGLALAFVAMKSALGRARPGVTALLYFVLYGTVRFTVEIFRGDSPRGLLFMTLSQLISLLLVAGGLSALGLLWALRPEHRAHTAPTRAKSNNDKVLTDELP